MDDNINGSIESSEAQINPQGQPAPTIGGDAARLTPINIEEEMRTSFIAYAMAVIINRALPDVRDGFKPVHRRIMYTMHELGMTPDKPFRKSVRIVGDVLGKFHPHGDTAVYDAMVRLGQDFSMRYMLVEGQGNYGSVDGDGAAAMRYTEARMAKIALEMIADIEKETVDFYPNFDNTLMQPAVLPARFPNLLVNGSSGIAVGMATNIPPHNLGEVIDAVLYLMENPDCAAEQLMAFVQGPDFPTGGVILGRAGIQEAYRTGRGRIVTRARSEIEQISANRSRVVVTEIPYMVNKAKLIEKIAELVHEKRLDGVSDIRDESDRSGMRIVIELKRDVNPAVVMNFLYKHTQLQDSFGAIMLALVDGEPKVLTLKQMLYYYLEHQKDVIVRRTRYELDKAEQRAHILEGLLIALDHIDEVVRIIRSSRNTAIAREALMAAFGLSEKQAQAILDMRLSRLTGLERERIEEELAQLRASIDYYRAVLASEAMVLDIIRKEILEIKRKYADARRTGIEAMEGEIDIADLIQEDDMVVSLTHFGYVKRLPKRTYRSQNRGGRGVTGMTTREEDYVERICVASTHDDILFFTNRGRVYGIKCYELGEAARTARGSAIVNVLQLDGGEKVTAMIVISAEQEGRCLVMATRDGLIKKTALDEFRNLRKNGLIAIVLREDDELIGVELTDGERELMLGTRGGMAIRFHESDVREMGRASMGVRGIELSPGDAVISLGVVSENAHVLAITSLGYGKRTDISEYRLQSRNGKGIQTARLTEKTGELVALLLIQAGLDLMLMTDDGTIIRTPVDSISVFGRVSQGVRLMRIGENQKVVAVAVAEPEEEIDDSAEAELVGGELSSSGERSETGEAAGDADDRPADTENDEI
ncbi:MAG: DNA gyrase subunit A [Oscillospiraceae bacterium]|jgi:DNA gyrase subunit A|nr:DNA gyrase subunit A [Oscillospiraceae bacterium]